MLRASALLLVGASADIQQEWNNFKMTYGKTYNGIDEEQKRFGIFKDNYDFIVKTNAQSLSYKLGVNLFTDLTGDEVAASYTGLKPKSTWADLPHLGTMQYSGKALADSVDWTTKGAVTPVKNQGQCGSCWSFSTTGALEGAWQIAGNTLTSLSEQQFVDCDKVDQGCNGGLMDNAFQFAEKNAICTEGSYPYKGVDGTCQASSCTVGIPKGDVTGYKDVAKDDMQALMEAVTQQPVSIAIEADKSAFQSYQSGVLSSTCGTSLDHGVLLVGYGSDNGQDYWKVKNSWGTTYGENGYVRLLRGKGGAGECGLLSGPPSYPVVSGSAPPGPSPGPSPPAPPSPPSPPAPGSTHYEKPPCRSDEEAVTIQGFTGSVCTPICTNTACPTDVPAGTTDKPSCVLQDSASGDKYCAITCLFGGCPTGATCQHSGLTGICMYPDANAAPTKQLELAQSTLIAV